MYIEKINLSRVITLLFICSLSIQSYGQVSENTLSMSLEECLEYAKENSITLQKAQLGIDDTQADQLSAKGAFLPTISGSVAQEVTSNPFRNSSEISNSSYGGSYGLDLSLNLYNGGKNRAVLQQSTLSTDIANLELEELSNSIEVSITEIYVEILYAIDQIKVAETSLNVSTKTEERGKVFLELGSINEVDYSQLESAKASYEYDLIVAKTDLSNLYVRLKHLLEISQEVSISIKEPQLSEDLFTVALPTIDDVYVSALSFRPEILSNELYITNAELNTKIAKAGYLPTVSLSAGTGISHNSSSDFSFTSQLRSNFTTSAGIRVSVPIFSNYSNKSAVLKAMNSVKTANLNLTEVEKDLYQTIETLHNNAVTTQSKFVVADYKLKATKKSMDLTNQQYELGMKNLIELLTEQDNYSQSLQEYLVNKYQFIYNKALLNYYKTNIIKL